jgi:hypothetical protein
LSSTNRGAVRVQDDFYATPAWATEAILPYLVTPNSVLEPSAGKGAILTVARKHWHSAEFVAVELDPWRAAACSSLGLETIKGDFLTRNIQRKFDLAIGNPPFALAERFVERCLGCAHQVAMLLRVGFVASSKRRKLWGLGPADFYVLPRRPQFAASLKCKSCSWRVTLPIEEARPARCPVCEGTRSVTTSDSSDYAWFVWGTNVTGKWQRLECK